MGNKPAHLIKNKITGHNDEMKIHFSCAHMRGCRNEQEDAHTTDGQLIFKGRPSNVAFFAIFDGHSGDATAKFLANNLETKFLLDDVDELPEIDEYYYYAAQGIDTNEKIPEGAEFKPSPYRSSKDLTENSTAEEIGEYLTNRERIEEKYMQCEEETINDPELCNSGAAAVTVFLKYKKMENSFDIICANVGDSRAVFYDCGLVSQLSNDHKPSVPTESARILAAAHYVVSNRVDGQLALSRSFGDKKYKSSISQIDMRKQAVVAVPEFISTTTNLEDITAKETNLEEASQQSETKAEDPSKHVEAASKPIVHAESSPYKFVILGCDGVWDVMSSADVCNFVARLMKEFDIFNPNVKVPANYHEPNLMEAFKKKADDWVYIPLENWGEAQYQQWEHTIPNPYPVFNNCLDVLTMSKIVYKELLAEKNVENSQQRDKYKKVYYNILELKNNHDLMEKSLQEHPFLITPEEKLAKITEILLDELVLLKNSADNVSAIIVLLDNHENIPESCEIKEFPEFPIPDGNANKTAEEKLKMKQDLAEMLKKIEGLVAELDKLYPEKKPEFED